MGSPPMGGCRAFMLYFRHQRLKRLFAPYISLQFLLMVGATRSAGEVPPSAAGVAQELRRISLDPNETYSVRDIHLVRGDLKVYLSEGTISFATPVAGRSVAMVFSTAGAEAGDAELMVLPPRRSDRESLLRFTKSPNLNEHFSDAVFLFTDDTYDEIHRQLADSTAEKTPGRAAELSSVWNPLIRNVAADLDVRLAEAILNPLSAEGLQKGFGGGLFEGIVQGRTIGAFDVSYLPEQPEALGVGTISSEKGPPHFQLWTAFKPRRTEMSLSPVLLSGFVIDTTIGVDLKQSCVTSVSANVATPHIRAVRFDISARMSVTAATIDGQPAEFYQRTSLHGATDEKESTVLIVADRELNQDQPHRIVIHHEGTVVSESEDGVYMVADRNVWFPHRNSEPASFDLTFHVPKRFQVVSIGTLIDERVDGDTRSVHRRTETPVRYAGFNFGEFESTASTNGPYRIECYANRSLFQKLNTNQEGGKPSPGAKRLSEVSDNAEALLTHFTREWGPLPLKSIAIAPIPGYFGQGFPGLIYLSTLSYLRANERPAKARDPLTDVFFSDLLLAHEIAHQWWGNVVTATDYRSEWIMESISNYAALELVEDAKGAIVRDEVLRFYRRELTAVPRDGAADPESTGPIEWGQRLIDMGGLEAWRIVTYEKGTWIMHMLRERMGRETYHLMLRQIIKDFSNKPLSNDDFRRVVSRFIPTEEPDASLELFFDTWVYGTGIPHLTLTTEKRGPKGAELQQSSVPDDFTLDVPVSIVGASGHRTRRWVRSNSEGASIPTSKGQTVELPAPAEFLYIP